MEVNKEPWANSWKKVMQLDAGAQGYTFKVESVADGKPGVLKILKHQHVNKARMRMRQEVSNLGILAKGGVHVPKVLDDGTAGYDDPKKVLYFVMEFIPGETLEKTLTQRGRLSLDESIAVTRALAEIVAAAHELNILHRDLKPGNVMVRDFQKKDIVMVDLGLSFNVDESEDLTETDETVGNKFLSLPESGVGGDDKRDKRSDITLLVGVLYYCVTGYQPKVLRDHPNALPPHQRPGRTVNQVLPDDPRLRSLEVFLDRGFEFRAEDRFQTCGELVDRLAKLAIVLQASTEDPNQVAARLAAELVIKDRNTQIHLIREKTQGLRGHFQTFSAKLRISPFQLLVGGAVSPPQLPPDYDPISTLNVMSVQVQSNPGMTIALSFAVGAKGQECSLFRFIQLANFPNQNPTIMPHCGVWEALTTFNPNKLPSESELMPLLQDSINIAMTALQKQILARVPSN